MSRVRAFRRHFLEHLELYVTILHFLHYLTLLGLYAVLSQSRFVVIYAFFWVKLFWLKPFLCKKKVVFFHL